MPLIVIAGIAVSVTLILRWRLESLAHRRRVDALTWRIHVNGIRGKSTVSRMIAGMLREHGLVTVAKSTGTFAAVINRDGVDEPIKRKGPPTILEQIELCRNFVTPDVDALVIECMALKPEYQKVSEQRIVRSNIGVITNVREDHQDVMGETLPEIARSLLSTCPLNGILVTSESNPEIIEIMEEVARSNGSQLIVADPDRITDEENNTFEFISFKENVTIALTLADIIGIPRDVAIRGMAKAEPDPGVLRMKELRIGDGPIQAAPGASKKVTWANLFAVNDRESMIAAMEKLDPFMTSDTTVVGILNNRSDRERRAIQFADVGVLDLEFDRLVTFGAYEGLVTDRVKKNGYEPAHILNLGDEHDFSQDQIIDQMITQMPTTHVLVVGFVNIHTHQAEEMLEYFEHEAAPWHADFDEELDAAVAGRTA
ncbi:MAG: poly-gamma-glutamate synthase PgsB [Ilumatobacter sp.]|uniref:poly-gamma-glutamate synthase PgsB n=1 Tax=Ilumatobacter sp. TaxID=1967498 RepID=UPI003C7391D9